MTVVALVTVRVMSSVQVFAKQFAFCFFREEISENLVSSSPTTEISSKSLEDLQNDRNNMTSEGCCETDDHCKDMEHRQPDVNQNGVHRTDSLNSGIVSPEAFTSFHGLNILSEQMGQDGEGNIIQII